MTRENVELIELKSMLYAIDRMYKALSDGYNHAYVGMKFQEHEKLKESDYLIWDIHLSREDEEYLEYIRSNKKKVDDAKLRIKENLFWSLQHLKSFNKIPDVFASEYNYKILEKLISEIIEKMYNVIKKWNLSVSEYDIYADERRVLVIKGEEKVLVLDVLNNTH